jgi:DNA processing protein
MQISKILDISPNYPDILREIPSPPKQLFMLGHLPPGPSLAVIGSRKASEYGRQVTYQIVSELAKAGLTIISGLAYGIDTVAQQATVEAGGRTVAVLGGGLNKIYPAANRNLAIKILETGGALVSEYDVGDRIYKTNFVARNRIVAGLSEAVLVTECHASSGALITVRFALEQGKTVMAIPGNITSPASAGPNNLLKKGAIPVTDATDVLAAMGYESGAIARMPVKADSAEEAQILELLRGGITQTDALIQTSGLSAQQFANIITLMEITGKVRNLGAGQWLAR